MRAKVLTEERLEQETEVVRRSGVYEAYSSDEIQAVLARVSRFRVGAAIPRPMLLLIQRSFCNAQITHLRPTYLYHPIRPACRTCPYPCALAWLLSYPAGEIYFDYLRVLLFGHYRSVKSAMMTSMDACWSAPTGFFLTIGVAREAAWQRMERFMTLLAGDELRRGRTVVRIQKREPAHATAPHQ